MALDAVMEKAARAWYSEKIAEDLVYNGDPVPGHIEHTGGDAERRTGKVHVRKSDISTPAYHDQVVDENGTPWFVVEPIPEAETAIDWTLNIEAGQSPIL